jgi:hypothetical protein
MYSKIQIGLDGSKTAEKVLQFDGTDVAHLNNGGC